MAEQALEVQALPLDEKGKLQLADTHQTFSVLKVRWVVPDKGEPFWSMVIDIAGRIRQTTFGSEENRDRILKALQSATSTGPVAGVALMQVETKAGQKAFVFILGDME